MGHLTEEAAAMLAQQRENKRLERSGAGKVMRLLAKKLATRGFIRKSTFFSREHGLIAHVIHVHKYTFGPCFRIHACVRIMNEATPHIILNGISCDKGFYYLVDDDNSFVAFATAMDEYILRLAEPWFETLTNPVLRAGGGGLQNGGGLHKDRIHALEEAIAGKEDAVRVASSKTLLGLAQKDA